MKNRFSLKFRLKFQFVVASTILSLVPVYSFCAATSTLVNQTLGMVDQEVVSQRDVLLSAYVDSAMKGKPTTPSLTPTELLKELNGLLVEKVVERELPSNSADDDEKKKMQSIWKEITADSFAHKVSFKEKEFDAIYLRKIHVHAFMDLKIASLMQTPSDEEVKNYYESNHSKFGSTPLDQVSDNIRNFLAQSQRESKTKAWFEALRKKYRAQNYIAEKDQK